VAELALKESERLQKELERLEKEVKEGKTGTSTSQVAAAEAAAQAAAADVLEAQPVSMLAVLRLGTGDSSHMYRLQTPHVKDLVTAWIDKR
jgi:cell division septum initiation protein DivIVA